MTTDRSQARTSHARGRETGLLRVTIQSGSVTVELALLRALSEAGHSVVLAGEGKHDVAARWPDSVTAVETSGIAAAIDTSDVVIVVDGRIALRPAERADGAAGPAAPPGALRCAKRLVILAPPDDDHAIRLADDARRAGAEWMRFEVDAVFGAAAHTEDLVSAMLSLVRSLPVVPVLPSSRIRFAPVFAADLGRLVAAALATRAAWGRVHHVRGREIVSVDDLLGLLADLSQRKLRRAALPSFLGGAASAVTHLAGVAPAHLDDETVARLTRQEARAATEPSRTLDAFAELGVATTPLHAALDRLASELPEQRPTDTYGSLEHKRFWVDLVNSAFDAEELLEEFRRHCADILPIEVDVERGATGTVERGRMLTAALPLRGHIQMRVEETLPRRITFATVEGHPIAGVVRFSTSSSNGGVRFAVEVFSRSATPLDFVALKAGGSIAQNITWTTVCERMKERSRGSCAEGVQHAIESLGEVEAREAETWIEALIRKRERGEHEAEAARAHR